MRTITVRFETPDTTNPDQFLATMFGDFADMNRQDQDANQITYTIVARS